MASEEPPQSTTPGPCPQGWAPSGLYLEEAGTGETGHTTQWLEQHLPGPHGESQESHQPGHSLTVREAAEAQRGGEPPQGHTARKPPRPALIPGLSVCLSACQSPPSCGQQPGPLSLLPSLGGRSDHVHRAAGPPPRAPARGWPGREEPRAASAAPPLRPALPADAGTWRRWKAPCFIFITQHALWRHPAGCLALQNLFIYMGAEEIGSFSASPKILSWGVLYSCLQGRGQD